MATTPFTLTPQSSVRQSIVTLCCIRATQALGFQTEFTTRPSPKSVQVSTGPTSPDSYPAGDPTMSRSQILFFALATSLLVPASGPAQGRLITRPCGPVPVLVQETPQHRPAPCGPSLVRIASEVKAALADRVVRYEVTETFVNRGPRVAEADYIFPLPAGAAFEDLKLSINGELVSGETMSADKARGIYEEIVRRQRDPALVEWMGSGLLRARIFPIQPGEEKKVVVRFQAVANREGDALRIDYKRGTDPDGSRNPKATVVRTNDDHSEEGPWSSFSLYYQPGNTYGEPYSPTHMLRSRSEGSTRLVEARGSASEITILLPLKRPNAAAMSVLTHAPGGEHGFALITITPPASAHRTISRDVTFVVDVSGSMSGKKLQQAKAAGFALLESLDESDRLRVIDFSTDVRSFRDGYVRATRNNVRDARRYIESLRAEGSTNISGALQAALEKESSRGDGERLPMLVFITDGEPTVGERNPDRIAALASKLRGETRIFAIGVSADVNATLVEQLAVEGRGTAHFVRNNESVERTVSLLASRLTSPVLTNVRVRTDGVRLSQVMPAGPIDVFAGQDLVILARYEGEGNANVRLEGETVDGPISWSTRAHFAEHSTSNAFVARLWATQRIGWLAAEKRRSGGSSEMDSEIRALGERYGIPTEFTSYLVLEPGMERTRRDAAPAALPQERGRLSTTATTDFSGRGVAAGRVTPQATAQAASSNEARFEDARLAAGQRQAKSMAELESLGALGSRSVGNRLFNLADGVWTDATHTARHRVIKVKPFSPLYFDLIKRYDSLGPVFALGERVIVAGRSVSIELAPDGVEQLSASELNQLVRDW